MIAKILTMIALISCARGLDSSTNSSQQSGRSVDHTAQQYEALVNQVSGSQDESLKVGLANYPSQSSSKKFLTITVSGAVGVTKYAFKIGKSAYMNCADGSGYKLSSNLNTPIVLQMDRYDEGPVTLCAIGGSGDSKWLPYRMANQVFWDNEAPSANAVVQPAPIQEAPPLDEEPEALEPVEEEENPLVHTDGYEYFKQSDNEYRCWAFCQPDDFAQGDWGCINSLNKTCVMPESSKKSSTSCTP
jgi:hypothetical protein